jgi:hypothetical protein
MRDRSIESVRKNPKTLSGIETLQSADIAAPTALWRKNPKTLSGIETNK